MDSATDRFTLDLVDWLAVRERTYEEMICAWANAGCVPIWEEAMRAGLITKHMVNERCVMRPTSLGLIEAEFRKELRRLDRKRHERHVADQPRPSNRALTASWTGPTLAGLERLSMPEPSSDLLDDDSTVSGIANE